MSIFSSFFRKKSTSQKTLSPQQAGNSNEIGNNGLTCSHCGANSFEYDSYYNEYTCKHCGYIEKNHMELPQARKPSIDKVKINEDIPIRENDLVNAVYDNDIEKVKVLVNKGVEVNLGGKSGGTTLLHQAIRYGFVDIARILIEAGADTHVREEFGKTPLHLAAQARLFDCVELLADHHVNLDEQISEKPDASGKVLTGNTALMESAQNDYTDMVTLLLKRGADPDIRGKGGFTALIIACVVGHYDCVKALLEGGADIDITEERGLTALDFAEDRGYDNIVNLLKKVRATRSGDTSSPCCWTCVHASLTPAPENKLVCTLDFRNVKVVSRDHLCSVYEKRAKKSKKDAEVQEVKKDKTLQAFVSSAWKKGEKNPETKEVSINDGVLEFLCPICSNTAFGRISDLDPIIGHNYACRECTSVFHVPGIFKTDPNHIDAKITGGVLVRIADYSEYCHNHPVYKSCVMAQKVNYQDSYGLFAFCPICYYIHKSSILSSFINLSISKSKGYGYAFLAKSLKSKQDMDALGSGHCPSPSCDGDSFIAIITNIPDYVCEYIDSKNI